MLISKLKLFGVVMLVLSLGAGAVGIRAGAAETPRTALNEVEALRADVEALRRLVLVTRERVQMLEKEVAVLKTRQPGPGRGSASAGFTRDVSQSKDKGALNTQLKEGRRAMAVQISTSSAVGGFVLPGSHVDVIHSIRGAESKVILEDILVMAIDLRPLRPEDKPDTVTGTATLEVTPQQALKLAAVKDSGTLLLALRAYDQVGKPTQESFTEAEEALKQLRQHPDNKVAADRLENALLLLKAQHKPKGSQKR